MKSLLLAVLMLLMSAVSASTTSSTSDGTSINPITDELKNPQFENHTNRIKTEVKVQSEKSVANSPQPEKKKRRIALKVVSGLAATFVLVVGILILSYTFNQH
ncbi:MAG: hypothetical protein ACK448_10995 [Bacteroidota bacterium]|jgi:CHASE3 domain sensor protein